MKFIPYSHQYIDKDDIREVVKVLKSDWLTQGPKIREFEDALCRYTGARYAVAVSSGTAALHITSLAAGIEAGDEVITSPITFIASANCILYCGGRPVFADVEEDTVNIDPRELEKRISKDTKAVIPVHFAGHPVDLESIYSIAKRHGLIVIEDAAHALGAEYKSSKIGSCRYSDMTVFSFHPVKSITSGEGGMVLTNRKDLYERLLKFCNHGITKNRDEFENDILGPWYYEMQLLGFNYRITDFQCALGLNQLKKLDGFIEKRKQIASDYNRELNKIDEIILPKEKRYAKSSWHIYYIRLKESHKRKVIFDRLRKMGIGVQVHYIPVHLQPYYRKNVGYKKGDYPRAERYYNSAISLPLYPGMTKNDIKRVINTLKRSLL